jgi:hypothetical protein|nr:MAG TPA: hypothetical protein [Caudoviricetes sp.]
MKTGQVQIFSNQTTVFNHPKDYNTKFKVRAFEFSYAPDWVLDSAMYKALEKSKKIKLIGSRADVAEIEMNGKVKSNEIDKALDSNEEVVKKNVEEINVDDNELQTYHEKSSKELYNLCLEKGIQVESKKPKEYYINKLIG